MREIDSRFFKNGTLSEDTTDTAPALGTLPRLFLKGV
jgi:hypothetical protein